MLDGHSNTDEESRVDALLHRCEGAYAPSTLSGYRVDLKYFELWCVEKARNWLPARPETVAAFVESQIAAYRVSTIKRRISAITFAHQISDLPSPTNHSAVRLALRRANRAKAQRPEQVQGLTHMVLEQIRDTAPTTLTGLRDVALVSVGYDTLCRSSEIARMRIEHLSWGASSAVRILIPFSKADSAGNGRVARLSPVTAECLNRWLDAAGIENGPLFQGLHMARPSGRPLWTSSIRRIVKRAAMRSGIPASAANQLSGHSMRVGAAQDMLVTGFDMLAIMQAGGWKKPDVVLRYVENAATQVLHERRWAALSDRVGMPSGQDDQ